MKKMMMAVMAFFLHFAFGVKASAYVVVGYDGEPFYFKNGSEGIAGACFDIIQEMCTREKVPCKFKVAPIPKMLEMLKAGEADIVCPLADSADRRQYLHFSDKIFKSRYVFFGPAEAATKIKTFEDLVGYTVSVFGPSVTSETLQRLHEKNGAVFTILTENDQMTSLLKAEKVAKSLAYINRDMGNRWINRSKSQLKELPVGAEDIFYYIGFSKKTFSEPLYQQFNKQLQIMKTAKYIDKTGEKFGLQVIQEKVVTTEPPPTPPPAAPAVQAPSGGPQ